MSETPTPGGVGQKYGFPSPYDLDDDLVKLVAYTIVSIRRDCERVMPKGAGTVMVAESMTAEAFTNWRIADYLASDKYLSLSPSEQLGPGEEKDLRVDFVVSRRWPKQSRAYEKRQLKVLHEISTALET